jgi:hypothetical protein
MIKMVNRITGTEMWVADNRVGEYMAAGHKLAVEPAEKPAKKPVKKPSKK